MKVKDLNEGDKLDLDLLIFQVNKGVTNKGAAYLSFQLQDSTGLMDAKYWNVSEDLIDRYKAGMVAHFKGDVLKHNGAKQLRINSVEILDLKTINLIDFVRSSSISKEKLIYEINKYIDSINNKIYAQVVSTIISKNEADFYAYPAASMIHHNFVGGLATHVLGMLELADFMSNKYDLIDRDLLISGVLLHDVGKIIELSSPIVTEYTLEGKLIGHISIIQAEIFNTAKTLGVENSEEVTLLRHMVLSHHGEYEYGSPVKPMLAEAELLSFIDNIDARMNVLDKALGDIDEGSFTQRIFAMENRQFYKKRSN